MTAEIVEIITEESIVIDSPGATETIIVEQECIEIVEVAEQGLPGPPGHPCAAGGSALTRVAGETISALRVVAEDAAGMVRVIDYRDADLIDGILGVSVTAALEGAEIDVVRSGPIDSAGLGLAPGRVYLGSAGALTQTAPSDGFDVLVGYASRADRLYVALHDNIQLEED